MWVTTNNSIKIEQCKPAIKAGEKVNLTKAIAEKLIKSGAVTPIESPQDVDASGDEESGD